MVDIAVPQGLRGRGFEVLDHRNLNASTFKCASLCSRGDLVYISAAGVVSRGATGVGANVRYAGFIDPNVVSAAEKDLRGAAHGVHGDYAAKDVDVVSVWQEGEFRVVAVSGVVGDGALVYPAADGKLSASQTGSDAAVGRASVGNGGVADDPITIRINFYAN